MKNQPRPSYQSPVNAILFVLCLASSGLAVHYPDTIWVKVVYYDFKANGTNPNFEACSPGVRRGEIQSYLDAWRKPVFKANLACNDRVGEWFRVSGRNGPDTPATQFVFNPVSKQWSWTGLVPYVVGGVTLPNEWVGPDYNPNYAMADIVMYDSLPMKLIDSVRGMYQYNNQSFFPLDNKGYGSETKKDCSGNLHNFSFTMEIHSFFTYSGGEVFRFTGDDDVFAFINGQLAMDIGGVHSATSDSIILDNVAAQLNLVKGKTYPFDFFYTERHTCAADIKITTDLFKPRPSEIIVRPDTLPVNPHDSLASLHDTSLTAGQCVTFRLHVVDDTLGLRPEFDSLVQWEILDTMGNVITFDTVAGQNRICVTKAYGCIKIRLTFRDPEDATNVIRDSIQLCVHQGAANHLRIESSPNLSASPRNDNPLRNLTIPATATKDTVYAILRDAYGNFVSPSQHTQWSVISGASIVSVAGGNASLGAGIISKLGPSGEAWVVARSTDFTGALFSDTLHVVVSDIAYDSLRIVTGQGGQQARISSLVINIGQDSMLIVEGHRLDGLGDHGWTTVAGAWTMSAGLRTILAPPASDSVWNFAPSDTGRGSISAGWAGLSYSITVLVKPGTPASIGVYPSAGQPGAQFGNPPYLSTVTYRYAAGSAIPLNAKLFDAINVWLRSYETDTALSNQITWTVRDSATGTFTSTMGTVSSLVGHATVFTPFAAFRTYLATATFSQGAIRLQYTVRFNVTAGTPAHLMVEASPDSSSSPNANNPIGRLQLQSTQTSQAVYAVIRDIYGNYVGRADSASWLTRDTQVVTVAHGPAVGLGQATITRVASTASRTWVVARLGSLADSVDVSVTDVTYNGLRIVVNSNGLKDVDTLVLRTDQDTTLLALGQRSDTKNWTEVSVAWHTAGVVTNPVAPNLASVFHFTPVTPAGGTIAISTTGTGGVVIRDSVIVIFEPGLARKLEIYSKPGTPLAADKYPDPTISDTVTAGTPLPLYAKIFDQSTVWLSGYEQNPSSITWRIQELAGNPPTGTLSTTQGYTSAFTPVRAYNTVYVIAELAVNGSIISDMVRIFVKPAAATHVVIEAKPDPNASPNADDPIGLIVFGSGDTVRYAYAVLRDAYGNFVGSYTAGIWQSLDTMLVKAASGFAAAGEGMVVRKGNAGDTRILVHSADFTLRDTADVRVDNITYDSLRVVVGDSAAIRGLVMRTDQDTTLLVQGKRSDTHTWEYVAADWKLIGSALVNPAAPKSATSWTFSPTDTGAGAIVVTLAASPTDTVRVSFVHGLAFKLVLYPGDNQPNRLTPLQSPLTPITVAAGDTFAMAARVLDQSNTWLSEYATITAPISWRIEQLSGNPPTDSLTGTAGYQSAFTSKRAYNQVYVIAAFELGAMRFYDTVQISVVPGAPSHLVLEPNPNWQGSPNRDNPVDSVTLLSNQNTVKVYAIIRDKNGNFVSYCLHTAWWARDSLVATVETGVSTIGEGVVNRGAGPGTQTIVTAVDLDNQLLSDTVAVTLASYFYTRLRIVAGDSADIDSLFLTTNNDTTLRVMGLRSDTKTWEYTFAQWKVSGTLTMSPTAPDVASAWTFYPAGAGEGTIRVTLGNDSATVPDTVRAAFVNGPPTTLRFELLTPPGKQIAGDTLVAVVRIQNRTGLIAGQYCFAPGSTHGPAVFQTLLAGGDRPAPVIVVDGASDSINKFPSSTITASECFDNGLDTVKIVLFNAPYDKDSVQQLFVSAAGLTSATQTFTLLPAALHLIALQDNQGRDIGDTISLHYPGDSRVIVSVGFDVYGNKIGPASGTWSTTGSLHQIAANTNVSRIYYESSNVKADEQGMIIAVASDTTGGVHRDGVYVRIKGPAARLVSASTRDVSGNGYLDEIVLVFSKKVTIPSSAAITVSYGGTAFTIDSISRPPADSDSVFTVYLAEQKTADPQSAWRPLVTVSGIPGMDASDSLTCADGAGPVVWSVVKTITSIGDRTQDLVTVEFSEPLQSVNGNALSASLMPSQIFDVWTVAGSGDTVLAGNALTGIPSLSRIVDSKTIQFYMSNGTDLTDKNLLSLRADTPGVADASQWANVPIKGNQRVAVKIKTAFPEFLQVAPNPAVPTLREEAAGVLHCSNNPLARTWVRQDQRGVLITFKVMPLANPSEPIQARLTIYDNIGNMVNWDASSDILPQEWRTGPTTAHDLDIYWNGTNRSGMIVAAGVYRVFLFLESQSQKKRLVGTIGITR
jgi:fibro-slime domain-containing protein